jgi:putative ABC transport system substrate-binding protein
MRAPASCIKETASLRTSRLIARGAPPRQREPATELVAISPDVILASATPALATLLQLTRTIPIVFVIVANPVGAGFVDSLARPGGNATGFTPFDYSIGAKWLELLKEIAPSVRPARGPRHAR